MASGPIFTDTSAWYAYIDKSDTEHAAAVKLVKNLDRPLITSNYIFDEVLTLVKLRMGYHVAINLGQKLLNQDVAGLVRLTRANAHETIHGSGRWASATCCSRIESFSSTA